MVIFRDKVNFYVVHNGVQLRVAVDFAKEQATRMRASDHPSPQILSSLKLHLIDKIPEFFRLVLQQMDVKIDREWVVSNAQNRPNTFRTTAKAEDFTNLKLFDAITDVSNVKASTLELTVTRNPGVGAFCLLTVYLKPQ